MKFGSGCMSNGETSFLTTDETGVCVQPVLHLFSFPCCLSDAILILSLSSSTCLSRNLWGLLYLFLSCLACLVGVCSSLYVSCCCPLAPSLASLPPQPASHPYPPSSPISPHHVWITRFLLTLRESIFLLAGCSFHLLVCPCRRGCEGKDLGYEDRSFLESGSHRRGSFLFSLSFLFFSIACYVSIHLISFFFFLSLFLPV